MSSPYLIGSQATASGGTSTVITSGVTSSPGDTLLLAVSAASSGVSVSGSPTDTAGNTYTAVPAPGGSNTTQNPAYVLMSAGATGGPGGGRTAAVTPSTTITVNWSATTGAKFGAAVGLNGVGVLDQNPATTDASSGTAAAITSSGLNGLNEQCVAVEVNRFAGGGGGTWASGWAPPLLAPTIAGTGSQWTTVAAQTVSSASPVTASFTLQSSTGWCMALLTFYKAITVTTSSLPGGSTGHAYSQALAATGGNGSYTWSVTSGSLPPGLSLSAGVISGTPAAAGSWAFTVKAADSAGNTATQALSITIAGVFPYAPLGVEVDLNLGGTWTDITSYVLQREGTSPAIAITRGRADETAKANPSSGSMQWNNRDGRFSPRNPTGPYYGLLGRNTPLRVSVPGPGTAYRAEDDNVSCCSAPALNITGSIDVRVDMAPSGYYPAVLACQGTPGQSSGAGVSWALFLNQDGSLTFAWVNASLAVQAASTASVTAQPIPLGRIAVRAALTASTGTVVFYTAPTMSGSWTVLATVTGSGATSINVSGAQIVGAGGPGTGGPPSANTAFTGLIYEMQVYNGIGGSGGTLAADPVFSAQTPGVSEFTDGQGNTWVLQGTSSIDARSYRGHLECSSLPQQWDSTGTDVWTPVSASGLLRRLQQGNSPVASAMRRALTLLTGDLYPAAYWPCEDSQGSAFIASGLPGGLPMGFSATPGFQGTAGSPSADSTFACSAQLPQVGSTTWSGPVSTPSGFAWTDNVTRFLLYETAGTVPNGTVLATVYSTGTVARLDLDYETGGLLGLTGFSAAGTQLFSTGYVAFAVDGVPLRVSMDLIQDGANITCQIQTVQPGIEGVTYSVTLSSATVGAVTSVAVNPRGAALGSTIMGQVSVQGTWASLYNEAQPLNAWAGEAAGMRFARLCTENALSFRVYGIPQITQLMGYQPIDTLANQLQYCEDADRGQIYEPRTCLGLGYRTFASLCSQSPAVTLDYTSAQIGGDGSQGLVPTDDDQYTINDVTVTRNSGSSVQMQVTTGPVSILPPPEGAGDYTTSLTVYCDYDTQLADIAGWMTWIGSANQERYPQVPLNLARSELSALITAITAVDIGGYVQVTNPPAWLPPGAIDQLAWGSTEKLGGFWWLLAWNTVPEAPYEVIILDDPVWGRLDTSGSALAVPASSGATTLTVTTPAGAPWTPNSGDLPFNLGVGGEEVTVTGVANGTAGLCRVGAFLDPGSMQVASFAAALTQWTGYGLPSPAACRYFLAASTFTYDTNMQAMVADGIKICLTVRPSYSPLSATDLANLTTLLQTLTTAGAVVDVCIWHEPYYSGLTSAQYMAAVRYYGPTVRQYYPLVFVTSVQSVQNNSENAWYPGDEWVDKCATDYYAYDYITDGFTLDLAATPANDAVPPKPFGIWELGTSTDPVVGQSSANASSFFTYITGYFQGRTAEALVNADLLWFNAGEHNLLGLDGGANTGFEGGLGNWTAANGTVADSATEAHTGTDSAKITASGSGSAGINQPSGTGGIPVAPSTACTVAGWFRAAATPRSCQSGVNWYTSGGTFISSGFPGATADTTSGFTQNAETVTSPSNAAYAQPVEQIESPAASEIHYVDDAIFAVQSADSTVIGFGDGSAPSSDPRIALITALHTALDNTSLPQLLTVTRSVNGVIKAQPAGSAVALYVPPVLALT